jgi:hypothetical protein
MSERWNCLLPALRAYTEGEQDIPEHQLRELVANLIGGYFSPSASRPGSSFDGVLPVGSDMRGGIRNRAIEEICSALRLRLSLARHRLSERRRVSSPPGVLAHASLMLSWGS